jgi:hypothetical protein
MVEINADFPDQLYAFFAFVFCSTRKNKEREPGTKLIRD